MYLFALAKVQSEPIGFQSETEDLWTFCRPDINTKPVPVKRRREIVNNPNFPLQVKLSFSVIF